MPSNPNHKLFDEFKRKYNNIIAPVIKEMKQANITTKNVDDIINKLFGIYKVEEETTGVILNLSVNAMIAGGATIANRTNAENWLLKNTWVKDQLNLSKTIHKNVKILKTNVSKILKADLGESVNWLKTAENIKDLKDLNAELPKYMKKLVKQGHKVLKDPELINDFKKQAKKAQKQIKKLANLGYKNTRLKKAYKNIIQQVKNMSKEGFEEAIKEALGAKTEYYAQRIARTEIANAYGNAKLLEAEENKNIIAIKSVLSKRHPKPDVCDLWAKGDLHGYGKGVYPKNKLPRYPYHVQCMCDIVLLTKNQVGKIKKISKNKQLSLFKSQNPQILNKKGEIPLYTTEVSKAKKVNL